MTEFELIRAFANAPRATRADIAQSLGLAAYDIATEEGVKRQFAAAKAANKLRELEQMLPAKPK